MTSQTEINEMVAVVDSEFASANREPAETAQEWLDAGFSVQRAREWIETARCFAPDAARALASEGLEPFQAAHRRADGYDTLAYEVANGDLSAERAALIFAAEVRGHTVDADGDVEISWAGSIPAGERRSIALDVTGWWSSKSKTVQVLVREIGGERRAWRHEDIEAEDLEAAERVVRDASQGGRDWMSE